MERYISVLSDEGPRNKMTENCCSDVSCGCGGSGIAENRMCMMASPPFKFDIEKVKELTNDPKHICRCCGRTANNSENLCSPTEIK